VQSKQRTKTKPAVHIEAKHPALTPRQQRLAELIARAIATAPRVVITRGTPPAPVRTKR